VPNRFLGCFRRRIIHRRNRSHHFGTQPINSAFECRPLGDLVADLGVDLRYLHADGGWSFRVVARNKNVWSLLFPMFAWRADWFNFSLRTHMKYRGRLRRASVTHLGWSIATCRGMHGVRQVLRLSRKMEAFHLISRRSDRSQTLAVGRGDTRTGGKPPWRLADGLTRMTGRWCDLPLRAARAWILVQTLYFCHC